MFLFVGSQENLKAQAAIGTWRDYLNYTRSVDVDQLHDKIYVASANGMFIYSTSDNSISKLNKINGLSDIGISMIRAYPERNILLIGYQNGNIDLIRNQSIQNFPDVRNSTVVGNKAIRHASFIGDFAYLSTGFGIVKFDVERLEIKDTYGIIGSGSISVNETTLFNDTLFAATNQGLFFGSLNTDLSIFNNWEADLSFPSLFGNVANCTAFGNRLYANTPSASPPGLYTRTQDTDWFNLLNAADINSLRNTPGGILVTTPNYIELKGPDGLTTLVSYSAYGSEQPNIARATADSFGNLNVADKNKGLVSIESSGNFEFIAADGPASSNCFSIIIGRDELWVASGAPARPGLWNNSFLWEGFYGLVDGKWKNFTRLNFPILNQKVFVDIPYVYPDPKIEGRTYIGSWFSGLLEIQDDEVLNYYSDDNSTLRERVEFVRGDGEPYIAVTGMTKDRNDNLWVLNGYSPMPISMRKPDGTWVGYDLNNAVGTANPLVHLIINREGHKWMIRNGSGLLVFNETGDGISGEEPIARFLTAQQGSGGLPTNDVYALVEDLDGQIWVGTADGIAVFFSPFDIFSDNPSDARQILVEQDGIFQYLFEGQPVSTIAVDGANRKWVGTFGSGVFLMSADGTEQLLRFTTDNSPLLSNEVRDIKINPKTGEVFIATEQGLISYQGDAVIGGSQNECSKVYPNPVRESYNGPISIEGLQRDAQVRITDTRGNLVYSTVSNGGKAVWDGKNLNNERVNTGVYFALSTNIDGSSSCVTKILVVK
jgi:hypothetical protein